MSVSPRLLEVVVCPDCHGELSLGPAVVFAGEDATPEELTCTGCGLVYPVVDDIPVLLVDDARKPA